MSEIVGVLAQLPARVLIREAVLLTLPFNTTFCSPFTAIPQRTRRSFIIAQITENETRNPISRPVRLHLPPHRRRQPGQGRRGYSGGGRRDCSLHPRRRLLDCPFCPCGPLGRWAAAPRQRSARGCSGGGGADGTPVALDVVGEHAGADGGGAAAAEDDPLPPSSEGGRGSGNGANSCTGRLSWSNTQIVSYLHIYIGKIKFCSF